jgi:hypothetical protein
MRTRRTAEQLKQTVLRTQAAIDSGTMTVKKACAKNKIKPSQFYDKRKTVGTTTHMVNNAEQRVARLKDSFEDRVIDRVAKIILERLGK